MIASPTLAPFTTSGTEIILGAGNTSFFETFNGSLDEVRIWNIALSQSEIQNTMNCELPAAQTGVVAYFNFNQGFNAYANTTETTLTNSVSGGGNGALVGFDLAGTSSNWLAGSPVTTGTTCAVFLETESFESAVNISIYPNPTNSIVNLKVNETVSVEIFDLLGKSINDSKIETGIATFDFSNYPSGVYLVKATNNNGATKTYKIIKN